MPPASVSANVAPSTAIEAVTVSIGISAVCPPRGVDDLKSLGEKLFAEADVQLYRAKSDGRNRVRWDAA